MPENRTIIFEPYELIPIIAEYYGCNEQGVELDDYSDEEIKEIILESK